MTSEKQRRAGYILPAQLTGHPLVCLQMQIPDVPEYRAAVRGALNELGKWWAWEKSGYGDTRATQAATYWRALLEALQIGDCGVTTMFDVRQNDEAPCTLEKTADGETWEPWANLQLCPPKIKAVAGRLFLSTDGGATWDPVQDTTYEEYDWRQDEPLRPARTGDNKRCLAAANAVAVFVELHREIVAWYESQGTLLQIGMAISVAISIMFPAGWPVVAGGLLTGAGAQVLLWTQALTNTAFTQEIQDQLRCIFWTWADEDGRWDEMAFSAVLADVQGISGDMWRLLRVYLGEIGGYTGLNNAGTTTSVATAECADCSGTWCYVFDFSLSDGGWQVISGGQYANGRWESTCVYSNAWYTRTYIRLDWPGPASAINAISVLYDASLGTGSPQNTYITVDDSAVVQQDPTLFGVDKVIARDGLNTVPNYITIYSSSDAWPDASRCNTGYTRIRRVTLSGTGPNPFGEDNCE